MPTCFVIMPITTPPPVREVYRDGDHFAHVLQHLFTPALEGLGYDIVPPSAAGSDVIQGEIIRNLDGADLVLCDVTTLNANVFFELGIRTALDKPVATVRDAHTDAIPFDHSIVNCHTYDGRLELWANDDEIAKLSAHVKACVARGGEHNTLWKYFGVEASARVGSAGTEDTDKLDYLVRQVEELASSSGRPLATSVAGGRVTRYELSNDSVERFLRWAESAFAEIGARFDAFVPEPDVVVLDLLGTGPPPHDRSGGLPPRLVLT